MYIKQLNSNVIVVNENGPIDGNIDDYPGFEAISELPENYTCLIYKLPPINERALELFNTLPKEVRAQFRAVKVSILNALEDGHIDEAHYILENISVPPQLELLKQNLLNILQP